MEIRVIRGLQKGARRGGTTGKSDNFKSGRDKGRQTIAKGVSPGSLNRFNK